MITLILLKIRLKNYDLAQKLYIVLILISIITFWILTNLYFTHDDNTSGFRTADIPSGRWIIFAIPAFIIITIVEKIAQKREQQ